jgi:hypothetical protein
VTIAPGDFDRWLDHGHVDAEAATALLTAPVEGMFAWHAVSTRVNHVANDDAQLILPMSAQEIEAERAAVSAAKPARKSAPRKAETSASGDDGQGSLF